MHDTMPTAVARIVSCTRVAPRFVLGACRARRLFVTSESRPNRTRRRWLFDAEGCAAQRPQSDAEGWAARCPHFDAEGCAAQRPHFDAEGCAAQRPHFDAEGCAAQRAAR